MGPDIRKKITDGIAKLKVPIPSKKLHSNESVTPRPQYVNE